MIVDKIMHYLSVNVKPYIFYAITIMIASMGIIYNLGFYISDGVISECGDNDLQIQQIVEQVKISPIYLSMFKTRKIAALLQGLAWLLVFLIVGYMGLKEQYKKKEKLRSLL